MTSQDGNTVPEGVAWTSASPHSPVSPQREVRESSPLGMPAGVNLLPTPVASRVQSYEHMMGTGNPKLGSITPPEEPQDNYTSPGVQTPAEAEIEKRELFMMLEKPRVRYDVEVVTKLIVYAGMFSFPEVQSHLSALCCVRNGQVLTCCRYRLVGY